MLFRQLSLFIYFCFLSFYTIALIKQSLIKQLFYVRPCVMMLSKTHVKVRELIKVCVGVWVCGCVCVLGYMCSQCLGSIT